MMQKLSMSKDKKRRSKMNDLIKITTNEKDEQLVDGRDLYNFLGIKAKFSDWIKNSIRDFDFIESVDFDSFSKNLDKPNGGRPTKEYSLTIGMAKELSMLARNETGKEARRYFIECERKAKGEIKPLTLKESLLAQVELIEKNEALQIENKELVKSAEVNAPKVDFFDAVVDSKTAVEMSKVAKSLSIKGYGRNNLFAFLRETKVLRPNNEPYQRFIDMGLFRVIEQKYNNGKGETKISFKTLVFQKGLDYIRREIEKKRR